MNSYTKTPVNTVRRTTPYQFPVLMHLYFLQVWFVCSWSVIMGLLAFAGSAAINAVFSLSVTALYLAYGLPICARFLGTNDFKPGPFHMGRLSAPIAVVAVLWMLFTSVVFMFPSTPQTTVEDMNYAIVVEGGIMILSLVYYFFPKYGGIHWFRGPIPTIDEVDEVEDQKSAKETKAVVKVEDRPDVSETNF